MPRSRLIALSSVHHRSRLAANASGWLLIATLAAWTSTQAADIPGNCLASFNVVDKSFPYQAQVLSCRQVEAKRASLFKEINALPGTGSVDIDALLKDMQLAQERIRRIEGEKNWVDIAEVIGGHFLATIGLVGCVETAGVGCALAAIGKVFALEQSIRMAASDAAKAAEAKKLRDQIAAWQGQIKGMKASAATVRARLVTDFTGLCTAVKENCL